jgi:DNA ligase 4
VIAHITTLSILKKCIWLSIFCLFLICFSEENVQPPEHKFEEHKEVERSHAENMPRKRSRPTSSRTARAAPRAVRRIRPRRGNQKAKIGDVESEESGPSECQDDENLDTDDTSKIEEGITNKNKGLPAPASKPAWRTGATKGNQHTKIDDSGSEESGPCETAQDDYISKMEVDNIDNDRGPPPGAQLFTLGEQEVKGVKLNTVEEKQDSPFQRTTAAEAMSSTPGEKIEQMADPLHAMLLDMLPLLGQKRTEDTSKAPLAKAETDPPAIGSSTSNSEILLPDAGTSGVPAPEPSAAPPKKKKVSYRDVVSELLKDW